eukprot:CCRYP_012477-RA/>CCRYP_012477-RA protein AED:0.48 eAED:0.67 QI:0/0/0/1/0/0/2/0/112
MNVLKWILRNPGTIITGQRLLCRDVNAQLPSAPQKKLGWSKAGATVSMIKRSVLPPKVVTKTVSETKNISTLAGKLQVQEVVTFRDLRLPEFDKNRHISQQRALVFDNDSVK